MSQLTQRKVTTDDDVQDDAEDVMEPKNKSLFVRPLEERDCEVLLSKLFYENIFYENAVLIARDTAGSKWFLCFVAASAFLFYFHEGSMILANIWFFSCILLVYLFMVYFVCYRSLYVGEDTSSAVVFYDYWSNSDAGRYMWVAIQDEQLVGAAGVVRSADENCAAVKRIVVLPDVRRQRVGTQLMLTLLDNCVTRGMEKIETTVTYKQLAAQKLFKKFGFRTSLKEFFRYGMPPFFSVRATKYWLSLEKVD